MKKIPLTGFAIKERLEYLRQEIRHERISYGELAELRELIPYIEVGDVELLEAAGVPEFEEVGTDCKEKCVHHADGGITIEKIKIDEG